jgi:hypothetical protein
MIINDAITIFKNKIIGIVMRLTGSLEQDKMTLKEMANGIGLRILI